jgi:replicative DNA helicase
MTIPPPQNIEIEESVLASIFLYQDKGTEILKPEHFYATKHQAIFKAIENLKARKEPPEIVLICQELTSMGHSLSDFAGAISKIQDQPPAGDLEISSRKIQALYQLRQIVQVSHAAIKRALAADPETVNATIGYLRAELCRIEASAPSCWKHLDEVIMECIDLADEKSKTKGITGVPSGYFPIDQLTGGWQGGDLIILAARPGMGKTAFAINCMRNAAMQGYGQGLLSLEMVAAQVGNRMLAIESQTDGMKFRTGQFNVLDWERLTDAAGKLQGLPIWIDDAPKATYTEIGAKCKALVEEKKARIIWIDYLGFIDGDKTAKSKVIEIETITRSLKATAKELNIPIVLVCQLNRKCEERGDKRPMLSDLRDSGAIEQDADLVAFLYNDEYYHGDASESKGITEFILDKQRNGATGYINLEWQPVFTKFVAHVG